MKGRFPKFLKKSPTVLGLGGVEILILVLGLLSSQLLGKKAYLGLLLTMIVLGLYKAFARFLDFQGLILSPSKRQSLDWMDHRRKIL